VDNRTGGTATTAEPGLVAPVESRHMVSKPVQTWSSLSQARANRWLPAPWRVRTSEAEPAAVPPP
jgi:hypothetical protein